MHPMMPALLLSCSRGLMVWCRKTLHRATFWLASIMKVLHLKSILALRPDAMAMSMRSTTLAGCLIQYSGQESIGTRRNPRPECGCCDSRMALMFGCRGWMTGTGPARITCTARTGATPPPLVSRHRSRISI
ncbi:hypothetical protein B0T25DRAFT_54540 [Lasiosphaeria hispida]|uniref:Uncharacterized protein n=1 Tax=Lasiosphaeria hispida TaxID=260671 RepID=A0AAJ0HVV1_9PEZI|nr:hypothetical protein B0T25DRAFT_54540 [Lasiosphaeria hispida]